MKSVFIVSETRRFGREVVENLPLEDFSVFTTTNLEDALRSVQDRDPNILVYDLDMYSRMRPKQACHLLQQTLGKRIPIILLHEASYGINRQIEAIGAIKTWQKPVRGTYLAKWLIDHPSELVDEDFLDESFAELPKELGTILVVEESGKICDQLAQLISHNSMTFVGARSVQSAVDEMAHLRPSLLIFDLDIPCHINSEEALTLINSWGNEHLPTVILVPSLDDIDCVLERTRADAFQVKPVSGTFIACWLKNNLDLLRNGEKESSVSATIEAAKTAEKSGLSLRGASAVEYLKTSVAIEFAEEVAETVETCEIEATDEELEARADEICREQVKIQRDKLLASEKPKFLYGNLLFLFCLLVSHLLALFIILPRPFSAKELRPAGRPLSKSTLAQKCDRVAKLIALSFDLTGVNSACVSTEAYDVIKHIELSQSLVYADEFLPAFDGEKVLLASKKYIANRHLAPIPGRKNMYAIWLEGKEKIASLKATAKAVLLLRSQVPYVQLKSMGYFLCFMQRSSGSFSASYKVGGTSGYRQNVANFKEVGDTALALLTLDELGIVGPWRKSAERALDFIMQEQTEAPFVVPHVNTIEAITMVLADAPQSSIKADDLHFYLAQVCERIAFDGATRFGTIKTYGSLTDDDSLQATALRVDTLILAYPMLRKEERALRRGLPTTIERAMDYILYRNIEKAKAVSLSCALCAMIRYQSAKG